MKLDHFITSCSDSIERIFLKQGCLHPMWHIIRKDGEQCILIEDTGLFEEMRALCATGNVLAYVFVAEGWTVEASDLTARQELQAHLRAGGSAGDHPRRREVILFSAENQMGQQFAHRDIIRMHAKPPSLGPLVISPIEGEIKGNAIGLFGSKTGAPTQ